MNVAQETYLKRIPSFLVQLSLSRDIFLYPLAALSSEARFSAQLDPVLKCEQRHLLRRHRKPPPRRARSLLHYQKRPENRDQYHRTRHMYSKLSYHNDIPSKDSMSTEEMKNHLALPQPLLYVTCLLPFRRKDLQIFFNFCTVYQTMYRKVCFT